MRGLVILLVTVLVILSSVAIAINSIQKQESPQNEIFKFSTFTSAVCERDNDIVKCKDELFINCNGEISKVTDIVECNGLSLDFNKPTGLATFGEDWIDPRV